MNEKQITLWRLAYCNKPSPSEEITEPTKSMEIDGHTFTVSYHFSNRKCYDFLPTPTVTFKADGKRISYKAALEMLN